MPKIITLDNLSEFKAKCDKAYASVYYFENGNGVVVSEDFYESLKPGDVIHYVDKREQEIDVLLTVQSINEFQAGPSLIRYAYTTGLTYGYSNRVQANFYPNAPVQYTDYGKFTGTTLYKHVVTGLGDLQLILFACDQNYQVSNSSTTDYLFDSLYILRTSSKGITYFAAERIGGGPPTLTSGFNLTLYYLDKTGVLSTTVEIGTIIDTITEL